MNGADVNPLLAFQWTPQPEAETFLRKQVDAFLDRSEFGRQLSTRCLDDAGVRLIDLIDHLVLPASAQLREGLQAAGFVPQDTEAPEGAVYVQPGGIFPRIVVRPGDGPVRMVIKVESVAAFEAVWQSGGEISGAPLAPVRRACVWRQGNDELAVIERHGYAGFGEPESSPATDLVLKHADLFRRRPRRLAEAAGFDLTERLVRAAIDELGRDYACDLFFAAERDFWQWRNRAGAAQRARQDRLGLGWANHDHHTYRSSRAWFARMIGIFELLGLQCRERFYAGREAGWGAQVMEQPETGIVVFADVDLSPDELRDDFAHEPLAERTSLGTVGLWCALHGESFLRAGMHHLECQFDFDALQTQLHAEAGINVMKPFTNFPYLRQAFTEGERWPVVAERIERLLAAGQITAEQAEAFRRDGAIGSHLENLERNAGFKGFNQTGVSEIITATDPRKHLTT